MEREDAFSRQRAQLPALCPTLPGRSWTLCLDLPSQSSTLMLHGRNTLPGSGAQWPHYASLWGVIHPHGHHEAAAPWTQGCSLPWMVSRDVPCLSNHNSPSPSLPTREDCGERLTADLSDCCSQVLSRKLLQGVCLILVPFVSSLSMLTYITLFL